MAPRKLRRVMGIGRDDSRIAHQGQQQSNRLLLAHEMTAYLKKGITQFLPRWKANGWVKSNGQPVLNQDLWDCCSAGL